MQELGSGDTRHRPIALGGALVTMVEPRRGHEVEYNRWYERDHFYAGCMIGAWTVQGGRYVATRDLKALRYPVDNDVVPRPHVGQLRRDLLDPRGQVRRVDGVGHRPGEVAARERPHVHRARPHPHGDVQVPLRVTSARTACRSSSRSTIARRTACCSSVSRWRASASTTSTAILARYPLPYVVGAEFTPVPLLGDAPSDVPRDRRRPALHRAVLRRRRPARRSGTRRSRSSAPTSRPPTWRPRSSAVRSAPRSPAPTPTPISSGSPHRLCARRPPGAGTNGARPRSGDDVSAAWRAMRRRAWRGRRRRPRVGLVHVGDLDHRRDRRRARGDRVARARASAAPRAFVCSGRRKPAHRHAARVGEDVGEQSPTARRHRRTSSRRSRRR